MTGNDLEVGREYTLAVIDETGKVKETLKVVYHGRRDGVDEQLEGFNYEFIRRSLFFDDNVTSHRIRDYNFRSIDGISSDVVIPIPDEHGKIIISGVYCPLFDNNSNLKRHYHTISTEERLEMLKELEGAQL